MTFQQLQQQVNFCACGCHRPTKPGNIFVNGHNSRMLSEETKQRMSIRARMKVGPKSTNWKGGHSDSYRRATRRRTFH